METKGKTFRQIEAEFALMNGVEQEVDEEKVKLNQDDWELKNFCQKTLTRACMDARVDYSLTLLTTLITVHDPLAAYFRQ